MRVTFLHENVENLVYISEMLKNTGQTFFFVLNVIVFEFFVKKMTYYENNPWHRQ